MLASYAPKPSVYDPVTVSAPFFKKKKSRPHLEILRPDHFSSRSVSPASSIYGDGLRPHDRPTRALSPARSLYSQSSSSSPSIASASSSGSRKELPMPPPSTSSWLTRAPRPPALNIVNPPASDFASPPETPMDVSEAELRRRQLEKATRILGESVPLELVFQPRHPLVKAFPDPPPRRSTESPMPGQQPREMLTERRPGKIVRRASLSLSAFTSKLRIGSNSTNHSRDSSQESHSASSSDHSHYSRQPPSPAPSAFTRSLPRRRSTVLGSPILFSFPKRPSHTRAQTPAPSTPTTPNSDLVIDIRSCDPSEHGHDDAEATPVREHPARLARSHFYSSSEILPRIVPIPALTHTHAPSEPHPHPARPETPFADYTRPTTPFEYTRPTTPFADLERVALEPEDEDEPTITGTKFLAPGVSRKERGQGWSGEWNQRDMQDVIQKLRSLK
ncbi:hypothetical protein B0H19DRAFT_1237471 [Mycena capillaripes]|nr:hypothetical protein B0H19DRAFT_1237471 [Mycena capillaripes]